MPPSRSTAPRVLAALLVLLAGCAGARAPRSGEAPAPPQPPEDRRAFAIAGGGALELALPPGWSAEEAGAGPAAPTTIRLEAPGAAFVALLTAFRSPGDGADHGGAAATAQLFAELARRNALAGSVEQEIPLEELVGDGVRGFWFSATDRELAGREPGPDEWRHVLQGAAAVGPVVLAFALLDDAPGPHRGELLELVRGARHLPDGERADPGPDHGRELDRGARTVPLRIAVPGKAWTILVDLPGFLMFRQRATEEGVLVVGQHPEEGLVASVLVRAARGADDASTCRAADLGKIRAALPELADLRLATAHGAARAAYAVPRLRGLRLREEHAHAWVLREGVCANLHVFTTEPGPGYEDRIERILASIRFGEEL
jgi:hypothetical protein